MSNLIDIPTKIRLLGRFERWFPIWSLRRQAKVIEHAFTNDIAKAKAAKDDKEYRLLLSQQQFEVSEYTEQIRSVHSQRLRIAAENLHIFIPDLKWEVGDLYGYRYLDHASDSKLYYAVKEQKDKNREYRLKLAGAITGIIGALIGLVAVWKK